MHNVEEVRCAEYTPYTRAEISSQRVVALRGRSSTLKPSPLHRAALTAASSAADNTYDLTRRFAYARVDWSARRPHLERAVDAAVLKVPLKRKWAIQDMDSRALTITKAGRREMPSRFGLII